MMDVRDGFWHVSLEKQSTYLMTFQTPFGSYRWKRTPFGISSAPEVFQRRMPEFIEGLDGIEVVADNFIAVGYGDTFEETTRDKHPLAFLKRCEERNIRLNDEKLKLRQSEVLFIGHIMTDKGLRVDPAKFRAANSNRQLKRRCRDFWVWHSTSSSSSRICQTSQSY